MTINKLQEAQQSSAQLSCAQVYGGIRKVETEVSLPGLAGYLYSHPCQSNRGGDIHYLSICGSGLLSRFCLADVVGHGSDVAIVSAEAHQLLRKAMNWSDHRRVLTTLNRLLVDRGLQSLTTIAMCTYFPVTRRLTYSYAGHLPAWYYSCSAARWSQLNMGNRPKGSVPRDLPLAVDPATEFSRGSIRAMVGDMIAIATDGITDALDGASRRLGDRGFGNALREADDQRPEQIVNHVVAHVLDYSDQERPEHDDLSLLVLRVEPFSAYSSIRTLVKNRLMSRTGPKSQTHP